MLSVSAEATSETVARPPRPILPPCWLLPIHRQPAMHRQHCGGRWKTGTPPTNATVVGKVSGNRIAEALGVFRKIGGCLKSSKKS